MIYDESNFNSSTSKYRSVPVFKYNKQLKPAYLKQYVYIPISKFFKIAYFYVSHNPTATTETSVTSPFKIYYDYSAAPQQQTYPEDIISSPNVSSNTIGNTDKFMIFNYIRDDTETGQTRYTFTTTEDLICDILIIGGGGAGGGDQGGGGGGGGLVYITNENLVAGTYNIMVGRGGQGISVGTNDGKDSSMGNYIAKGGGGGGFYTDSSKSFGRSGGSGGGGGGISFLPNAAGGSSMQQIYSGRGFGNIGGRAGAYGSQLYCGGGGGAGEPGVNGTNTAAGRGGNGRLINITGQNIYYAGGGGGSIRAGVGIVGGLGGLGGGGNGTQDDISVSNPPNGNSGKNALPNTGGGGGGVSRGEGIPGGSGGSGTVIIRYRLPSQQTSGIPLKDLNNNMNVAENMYVSNNITNNIKTSMNDYLYYSSTLYNDYKNTDTTVMDIFSIMNYTGNNKVNYRYLATYLNNKVDYFNTDKLIAEKKEWQRQLKIHIDNSSTTITGDQEIIKIDNLSNNIKAINYNEKKPMNAPILKNVPITNIFCSSNNNIYLTYDTITNLNGINLLTPNLTPAIYIEAIT
jgi:hypothetical protein